MWQILFIPKEWQQGIWVMNVYSVRFSWGFKSPLNEGRSLTDVTDFLKGQ